MALVINSYLAILIFLPIAALATWRISVFLVVEEGPFGFMAWIRRKLGVKEVRQSRTGVPVKLWRNLETLFDRALQDTRPFDEKMEECLAIFHHLNEITVMETTAENPVGKLFTCVWCMSFWVAFIGAWPISILAISITPAMGLLVALAVSALAIGYDRLLRRG